jgi:hypothetical protein
MDPHSQHTGFSVSSNKSLLQNKSTIPSSTNNVVTIHYANMERKFKVADVSERNLQLAFELEEDTLMLLRSLQVILSLQKLFIPKNLCHSF